MAKLFASRLSSLRVLCALYVVAHHLLRSSNGLGNVFRFGQEAVLIFFLLSGRVIKMSEAEGTSSTKEFYLKRINRIYPPLLLALAISTLLHLRGAIPTPFRISELIGTLFSLQDISSLKPGVISNPYLGNAPLWSLSYEMFFYAMYPIIRNIGIHNRRLYNLTPILISVSGMTTYLIYPNHLSLVAGYLVVWWIGFRYTELWMQPKDVRFLLIGILIIFSILYLYCLNHGFGGFGIFPGLFLRHFAFVLFLSLFSKLSKFRKLVSSFLDLTKPLSKLANISYGIYILHFPFLIQWPSRTDSELTFHIFLCFISAYLIESKKWNPLYMKTQDKRIQY